MSESIELFIKGLKDSLRIPQAFMVLAFSETLLKKTILCVFINGVIYLGSILLYNTAISLLQNIFGNSELLIVFLAKYLLGILYILWLLIVYLMSMTLTTFWA